ncbi:hypothetical protein [Streptomyces mirabilis]|uniref:hypothetical protein n=1 Tax=Streptomyces mirabilis TaxID=68239 RepID=UPI0036A867D9
MSWPLCRLSAYTTGGASGRLSSVSASVAHAYLIAAGVPAKLDRKWATALVAELKEESCTAGSVAVVLKSWAV